MAHKDTPDKIAVRRRPRQTRSSMTVDAILEAAGQLFAQGGFAGTSTTKIAERAGVGVGSLYEYFPNKDSLVAKLLKRHCDRMIAAFAEAFRAAEGQPLSAVVEAFIEATYAAYATDAKLHRVLLAQMGRVSKPHHLWRVSRAIVEMLETALTHCGASVRRPSVRLAAFVVESSVEAATHKALMYAPDVFVGDLRAELKVLALAYLRSPGTEG
ncbi:MULTISPECIES: TetR/AcrR family transcriptional regulator [Cupriavidus]